MKTTTFNLTEASEILLGILYRQFLEKPDTYYNGYDIIKQINPSFNDEIARDLVDYLHSPRLIQMRNAKKKDGWIKMTTHGALYYENLIAKYPDKIKSFATSIDKIAKSQKIN